MRKVGENMNIRIEKYVITSDNLQFILNEAVHRGTKSKREGEEYLRPISYHPTLDTLLMSLFNRETRLNNCTEIDALHDHIARCVLTVEKLAGMVSGVKL